MVHLSTYKLTLSRRSSFYLKIFLLTLAATSKYFYLGEEFYVYYLTPIVGAVEIYNFSAASSEYKLLFLSNIKRCGMAV